MLEYIQSEDHQDLQLQIQLLRYTPFLVDSSLQEHHLTVLLPEDMETKLAAFCHNYSH